MNVSHDFKKQKVEFWFDPVCPWTWITSRWASEVDEKLNLEIEWHPFSLKILNENNEDTSHAEWHDHGHLMGKIGVAVKEQVGNTKLAKFYELVGTKLHPEKRTDITQILKESLDAIGLAESLIDTVNDEHHEDLLRKSTARGLELVGPGVGVPIISINENAFFGPVVSPAPHGVDALNLWQALSLAIETKGFSELKRGRSGGIDFS